MTRELPGGRVTFAFTDVVGSTRAFNTFGETYVAAVRRMHQIIAATAERFAGVVVSTEGDGAFLAFPTAPAALDTLTEIQRHFETEAAAAKDPDVLALRIRAGAHTGHATPLGGEYVSLAVHHAARVAAAAGAGQLIVSQSVQYDLDAPRGDQLGAFELKDIPEPVVLWRVVGDATPPRATPARRTNVAAAHTSFVGRERELAVMRDLLAAPGILTLTGPGGLGKSRLASEVAFLEAKRWNGGAWLAELAAIDASEQILDAVAAAVGAEAGSSSDALSRELERRGELLLVLDGCDHVIDAAAELAAKLGERCPSLHIVCTSREPLEVEGEQVLRLQPLHDRSGDGPTAASVADGARVASGEAAGDAERLFFQRAAAAGAMLSDADLPTVSRICRHLDGLPLAIELAAARAPNMPVADLADALDSGELQLRRRSGQRHQRSLHDLVGWSLRLLTEGQRTSLLALTVFPGHFGSADAKEVLAAVPGAPVSVLPELTRRSLVDLDGDRFRLLLTIRDVAREELRLQPTLADAAHRALVQWALNGCAPQGVRPKMADDLDTALAVASALRWGLDAGMTGLSPLMRRLRSWTQETAGDGGANELALRILARPLGMTPDEIILQSVAAEVAMGIGWATAGDEEIVARVRQLMDAARSTADVHAQYEATGVAAITLSKCGDSAGALAAGHEALGFAEREPTLRFARGIELCNLALLHYVKGDLDAAEDYLRLSTEAHRDNGDIVNVAVNQCNLAEMLLDRGNPEAAEAELRSALRMAGEVRTPATVAMGLLVEAMAARGALDGARALAVEARPALEQMAAADPSMVAQRDRLYGVLDALGQAVNDHK